MTTILGIWPYANDSPEKRTAFLLGEVAEKFLDLEPKHLSMCITDEAAAKIKSPAPKWYKGDELVATITIKIDDNAKLDKICKQIEQVGYQVGRYETDMSVYKDYGDNQHFRKRDWPDGQASPTVMAVTLLTRPRKYSKAQWIERWHGKMSPESEKIQPRARYVRHVVKSRVGNAPAFDGVVEEAWPSAKHIHNLFLFYCADNRWQLMKNMWTMLRCITHFHNLFKIRTVIMTEYFLKTEYH